MTRRRGSGTLMPASCWSGTSEPYASTMIFSTRPGVARPVRIPPNSSWRCATALRILSRHSSNTSVRISSPASLIARASSHRLGRLGADQSPDRLPEQCPVNVPGRAHVEHDDRQLVVHAERDGRRVHDLEAKDEHLGGGHLP